MNKESENCQSVCHSSPNGDSPNVLEVQNSPNDDSPNFIVVQMATARMSFQPKIVQMTLVQMSQVVQMAIVHQGIDQTGVDRFDPNYRPDLIGSQQWTFHRNLIPSASSQSCQHFEQEWLLQPRYYLALLCLICIFTALSHIAVTITICNVCIFRGLKMYSIDQKISILKSYNFISMDEKAIFFGFQPPAILESWILYAICNYCLCKTISLSGSQI